MDDCSFIVPRLVHQTWKSAEMPDFLTRCVLSVRSMNPSWKHCFYTDEQLESAFEGVAEMSIDDFRKIPSGIERADVFRCAILYKLGGIYCDLDIEAIQPFDTLLAAAYAAGLVRPETEVLATTDHPIHCSRMFGAEITMNHIMIAKPGAVFFAKYLARVARLAREGHLGGDPVHTTGPLAMTHLLHSNGGTEKMRVSILPSSWINPLPDMQLPFPEISVYDRLIRTGLWRTRLKSYVVHYWWHSYCDRPSTFDQYGELLFRS